MVPGQRQGPAHGPFFQHPHELVDSYVFDGGRSAAAISLFDAPVTHPQPAGAFQVDSRALQTVPVVFEKLAGSTSTSWAHFAHILLQDWNQPLLKDLWLLLLGI